MDLMSELVLRGGVVDLTTLVSLCGAAAARHAVRSGALERIAWGRYAVPEAHPGIKVAFSVAGVLSYRSAAAYWGWAQKTPDGLPEVTVARNRRIEPSLRKRLTPHWSDLPEEHVVKGVVTTKQRTLVDCMRMLPFDEALAIADSALRSGDFTKAELLDMAMNTRGRGRTRIIGVARAAVSDSANAFESVLRAQSLLVPGLTVAAQQPLEVGGMVLHPDLMDGDLKVVLEAEGFEWHHQSAQLTRDCRRYNLFVLDGWIVVRFSWYLVMHQAAYVHQVLIETREAARRRHHRHANVASAA